jgi:hypothetical protein
MISLGAPSACKLNKNTNHLCCNSAYIIRKGFPDFFVFNDLNPKLGGE